MERQPSIEFRRNLILLAWGLAAVASVFPELPWLLAFPLFPLGLPLGIPGLRETGAQLPTPTGPTNVAAVFLGLAAVGWLIYLAISLTALVTKRRVLFFVFYGILCGMLVLNVRGCQAFLKQLE